MRKFFKQLFCLHNYVKHYGWHPARLCGFHIWECEHCGKIVKREPWNPPIDFDGEL